MWAHLAMPVGFKTNTSPRASRGTTVPAVLVTVTGNEFATKSKPWSTITFTLSIPVPTLCTFDHTATARFKQENVLTTAQRQSKNGAEKKVDGGSVLHRY